MGQSYADTRQRKWEQESRMPRPSIGVESRQSCGTVENKGEGEQNTELSRTQPAERGLAEKQDDAGHEQRIREIPDGGLPEVVLENSSGSGEDEQQWVHLSRNEVGIPQIWHAPVSRTSRPASPAERGDVSHVQKVAEAQSDDLTCLPRGEDSQRRTPLRHAQN